MTHLASSSRTTSDENTRKVQVQLVDDALVLLCQRCGRPFQTDVIRALCGACQRAQEVAR